MDVLATQDIANDLAFRVALRQSEIRYRRLFEAAHDGVLILDSASRKITDANPFMSRLLGYRHEELLGRRRIRGIVSTGVGRRIDVRRSPLKSRPRKKIVGRNGKAFSSMCKFLDKSSVAQFLDRGLKGRLHFP